MNKQRRRALRSVMRDIDDAQKSIGSILEEEQETLENMPESLQYSEKGEQMQEYIDILDNACSSCEDLVSSLSEIEGW